ncbi:hypothetical protein GUJ93_ZPchr0006g46060 [Zizania palustris]|uniref:Uncharacterized protein n=1 Tax=Zizania palustris TaxID=103762 RepID=A0A8J5SVY9_ZIZPA|nr:hypothetical protein GUJ93_ZPchr0006g46060 [Zizania palustris]
MDCSHAGSVPQLAALSRAAMRPAWWLWTSPSAVKFYKPSPVEPNDFKKEIFPVNSEPSRYKKTAEPSGSICYTFLLARRRLHLLSSSVAAIGFLGSLDLRLSRGGWLGPSSSCPRSAVVTRSLRRIHWHQMLPSVVPMGFPLSWVSRLPPPLAASRRRAGTRGHLLPRPQR